MTQETLKKAVELNEKFQQLSEISINLEKLKNTKMVLCIGDYRKNEFIQEYELTGVLRTALEKAIDYTLNEIEKEIEAL